MDYAELLFKRLELILLIVIFLNDVYTLLSAPLRLADTKNLRSVLLLAHQGLHGADLLQHVLGLLHALKVRILIKLGKATVLRQVISH